MTMTIGFITTFETSTQTPSNGVMQIVANSVTNGKVLEISGTSYGRLTDGDCEDLPKGSRRLPHCRYIG